MGSAGGGGGLTVAHHALQLAKHRIVRDGVPRLFLRRLPGADIEEPWPVTDVMVITGSEKPPPGFTQITLSPNGHTADFNAHTSKRTWFGHTVYLCLRRDPNRMPLVDLTAGIRHGRRDDRDAVDGQLQASLAKLSVWMIKDSGHESMA